MRIEPAAGGSRIRIVPDPGRLEIEVRGVRRSRAAIEIVKSATAASDAQRSYDAANVELRKGDASAAALLFAEAEQRSGKDVLMWRRARAMQIYVRGFVLGDLAAGERLVATSTVAERDGEGRVVMGYLRGMISRLAGDRRAALRALDEGTLWGRRLASPALRFTKNEHALTLIELGKNEDADRIFAEILAADSNLDPCARAELLGNRGWALQFVPARRAEAELFLRQTSQLHSSSCENPLQQNNTRVNLALLALDRGDLEGTAKWLAEIHGPERLEASVWRQLIEARSMLARGDAEKARRSFAEIERAAAEASIEPLEWSARLGLGRALEALGRGAEAVAAYRRAEEILERKGALIEIDRGRYSYLEDRRESAWALIEALLAGGDTTGAMNAARRAQRRLILSAAAGDAVQRLSPDARAIWLERRRVYLAARSELDLAIEREWQAPRSERAERVAARQLLAAKTRAALDASLEMFGDFSAARAPLATPAKGELLFLAVPLREEIAGFAATDHNTQVVLAKPEDVDWSNVFAAELRAAEQIRVLGRAFIASNRASVVYSLDLPPVDLEPRRSKRALVIGDPQGNLQWARHEAKVVADQLRARGWNVTLETGVAARPQKMIAQLASIDLLHFAGHGRAAGAEGWESALLFSDGEVRLGDVLTSSRAPAAIVLSGCETAGAPEGSITAGIGVAQAFLAAGAGAVVAADETVTDRVALELATTLYAEWQDDVAFEEAFRRASAKLEDRGEAGRAFRLLVR